MGTNRAEGTLQDGVSIYVEAGVPSLTLHIFVLRTYSQVRLLLNACSFQSEPLVSEEAPCLLGFAWHPETYMWCLTVFYIRLYSCPFLTLQKATISHVSPTAFTCSRVQAVCATTWGVTSARPCSSRWGAGLLVCPEPFSFGLCLFPVPVRTHETTNLTSKHQCEFCSHTWKAWAVLALSFR